MPTPDELKTAYAANQPEPKRSILDNLKGRASTKPIAASGSQAPGIAQKLALAQSELERLQAQHGDIALDALLSVEGADGRLTTLEKDIATARAEVVKLKAAHGAAISRDEASILAQRASLYKAQFNTVKRQLETRDRAAQEMQEHFTIVATAFKTMIESSAAARRACPVGCQWPEAGLPDVIEVQGIRQLVANEMFRVAGDPRLDGRTSYPGSVATPGNEGQPEKIMPLVDRLREHSAFVLAKLTGKSPR